MAQACQTPYSIFLLPAADTTCPPSTENPSHSLPLMPLVRPSSPRLQEEKSGSFPDRPNRAETHPKGRKARPHPDTGNGTQLAGVADVGAAAHRSLLHVDDDFRLRLGDGQAVTLDPIQAPLA